MKRRRCLHCDDIPARYPEADPKFCLLRCALAFAVDAATLMRWCPIHRDWRDLNNDQKCPQCVTENIPDEHD